jgi:hypothetical protein
MANQETYWARLKKKLTRIATVILRIFAFMLVAVFLFNLYQDLQMNGYVPHTQSVNLYFRGEWLTNESRECTADIWDLAAGSLSSLYCPVDPEGRQGTPHKISIKFWGRTSRPGIASRRVEWDWRCVRNQDEFTCYAEN